MAKTYRIGIGMPVYNGERYIEESLKTILAQTFEDFRLFIADNASTDKTPQICLDYASKDNRITYLKNPVNIGAPGNYSKCFYPTDSEYFRWSNSDDLLEPRLLEKTIAVLDADPSTVLAYGKTQLIDQDGINQGPYDDNLDLRQDRASDRFISCLKQIGLNNVMYGLIRRKALAQTKLMKGFLAADINLVAELSLYGKFKEIPDILFSRRMHPGASSWDRKDPNRQKEFWDPRKRKLILQSWRKKLAQFQEVGHAPIPISQKMAVFNYLLRSAYWEKSEIMGDLSDLIRFGLSPRKTTLKASKSEE